MDTIRHFIVVWNPTLWNGDMPELGRREFLALTAVTATSGIVTQPSRADPVPRRTKRRAEEPSTTECGETVTDSTAGHGRESKARTASADNRRERAFFSDDTRSPVDFRSALTPTVLGFVLSVVGIIHQMVQGR